MKTRKLFVPFLVTVLLTAVTTYKVYDSNHNLIEIWEEKNNTIEIYGYPDYLRKGYIVKEQDKWIEYDTNHMEKRTIIREEGKK